MARQPARLVDKILIGADPAESPVEVNPKIEFAIDLKVAKALGDGDRTGDIGPGRSARSVSPTNERERGEQDGGRLEALSPGEGR
jgi:hypothetical protein